MKNNKTGPAMPSLSLDPHRCRTTVSDTSDENLRLRLHGNRSVVFSASALQ